ncbi:MAG: preprotein translocase subunit SecY [Patescibacteria group bacterium]|nr:preprotein translocase subunit SecY [Patescibacteria group bacterium]
MWDKIEKIWKARDLRNNILFVLALLLVYRLIAHIPVPGVNIAALQNLFASNQALGLLNLFSGGGMRNFSLVLMGVGPYITSSIIFQLLAMIVPSLEQMQKDEVGRQKVTMWTRWLTVPLAMLQSYGMIALLRSYLSQITPFDVVSIMITTTAGTVFLMWLGELISEKKIGNGVSMIIFAGIVARLPQDILQTFSVYDPSKLFTIMAFVVVAVVTVIGIVIINEGQRNIPVQHARQIRGNRTFGGTTTHLPLRVNMGGVIPIIFAISVILFPEMIAQFFQHAKTEWIANAAVWIMHAWSNQLIYGIMYFVLVFAFTYFYTEVIFHPDQIAENLQKQGAFIPGIRPGIQTQEYLANTTYKIIFVGALFLGLIAVLPLIIKSFTQIGSLAIGGTSILIVVAVVIDMVKQIEAQLTMREYEGM